MLPAVETAFRRGSYVIMLLCVAGFFSVCSCHRLSCSPEKVLQQLFVSFGAIVWDRMTVTMI